MSNRSRACPISRVPRQVDNLLVVDPHYEDHDELVAAVAQLVAHAEGHLAGAGNARAAVSDVHAGGGDENVGEVHRRRAAADALAGETIEQCAGAAADLGAAEGTMDVEGDGGHALPDIVDDAAVTIGGQQDADALRVLGC